MNKNQDRHSVDSHEVYEYVYTRRRFNIDMLFYSAMMFALLLIRSIGVIFYKDAYVYSLLDTTTLMLFSIFLGFAIKCVVLLHRSRKIGKVNTNTNEIEIVSDTDDGLDDVVRNRRV